MTAASGGSTVDSGGYRYHTFTSSGTLVISTGGSLEYLIVGGGGGGGGSQTDGYAAGGGGAGGLLTGSTTVSAGSISVTVGAGGAGGSAGSNNGAAGSNSVLAGIATATGGGYGGAGTTGSGVNGGSGGSGGGGSKDGTGGAGTGGQGSAGGAGYGASHFGAGAGGGAGGVGGPGLNGTGGAGGAGSTVWGVAYAGGGGGGARTGGSTPSTATAGGGAGGDQANGTNGTANTGGGGGGAGTAGASYAGGSGGSGIVVVRYLIDGGDPDPDPDPEPGGGDETTGSGRSGSKFGCGATEVWVCDRALRKPLVPLWFQRAEWARELSQVSAATVDIPEARCSPLSDGSLDGQIETWKHGLMVIRDGEIEWRGPIVDVSRPPGSDVVTIGARDKMQWMDRRFVEVALEYGLVDDATMFDILLLEGVRRDNRFRLSSSSRPGGNAAKRSYPANGTTSILSLMGDLTQADMEWTMVDDILVSGVDLWRDFAQLSVTEEAFAERIGCRFDGLSRGNSWKISGARGETEEIFGQYEDWTVDVGLLQQATEEQGLLDSPGAVELARSRVLRNKREPVVVELPALSSNFPATMGEIAPGQRLDLAVEDPVFSPSGRYRVVQLKVSIGQTEEGQTEVANIGIEEFI